jgi:hypothetical protein
MNEFDILPTQVGNSAMLKLGNNLLQNPVCSGFILFNHDATESRSLPEFVMVHFSATHRKARSTATKQAFDDRAFLFQALWTMDVQLDSQDTDDHAACLYQREVLTSSISNTSMMSPTLTSL